MVCGLIYLFILLKQPICVDGLHNSILGCAHYFVAHILSPQPWLLPHASDIEFTFKIYMDKFGPMF